MKTSHLLFVLVAIALRPHFSEGGTLILQGTLRDQAPETMNHSRWPATWWTYGAWTNNPNDGTCGTANNGLGFPNSDFELPLYLYANPHTPGLTKGGVQSNGEFGLVGNCCNASNAWTNCGRLGADRTPVYAYTGGSPLGTIRNPTSFSNWFHDTDQTYEMSYNITLTSTGSNRLYTYSNTYFFPLDGKGWKDSNKADPDDPAKQHNYAYCYEIHGRFSYQGGEVFNFEGDDDVWVYLDNRLVIDLGGVHTVSTASVQLDQMGLVKGTNYRFDFFYCERHTTNSKLQITTSIEIACTYYDRCDICEGDGQSCCTAADLAICDDHNACTTDKCAVIDPPNVSCQHIPIVCDDGSQCTSDRCDTVKGCIYDTILCTDNNVCTNDLCLNATGCSFPPITCPTDKCHPASCDPVKGCSNTTKDCNDNDACTKDSCDPNSGCLNPKINCDDGNACTVDTCDKIKGCQYAPLVCNDTNACTDDICDTTSGCRNPPKTCNDNNACTADTCDKVLGCQFKNITCNDGDSCTKDSCDIINGCSFQKITCNDNNACTADTCDKVKGCVFTNTTCAAPDACTNAYCDTSSGCGRLTKNCDDQNACTIDGCNPTTGCTHDDLVCNDNDKCTSDSCVKASGCLFTPISASCDDNDACTIDGCNSTTGCTHAKVNCDDNDACTADSCNPASGCSNTPIPCTDNDACTNNNCDKIKGCLVTNVTCNDNDECTVDKCDSASGCQYNAKDCNDNDACTADSCDKVLGCQHQPIDCNRCKDINGVTKVCPPLDGNLCFPVDCDPGSGACNITRAIVCNDKSNCTADSCNPTSGVCVFDAVSCDDHDECTIDSCDVITGCHHQNKSCDDNNPCTADLCQVNGTCSHTPIAALCIQCAANPDPCITTDPCNPKQCVADQCVSTVFSCEVPNKCSLDNCYVNASSGLATCNYTAVTCPFDPCHPQECNQDTGVCAPLTDAVCDDNNLCTDDSCAIEAGTFKCSFTPKNCPGDACNPSSCNLTTGACQNTPYLCDDSSMCTDDSCEIVGGLPQCSYKPHDCVTVDICQPKSCNASTGVCAVVSVKNCDDLNPCTIDSCANVSGVATCKAEPVVCNNTDLCNPQTCELATGQCITTPVLCDDGNKCTDDLCVVNGAFANCTFPVKSCAGYDFGDNCSLTTCDENVGCVPGAWTCDDSNICTTDTCVGRFNCTNELSVCDDSNACTVDICNSSAPNVASACSYEPFVCQAPNLCQNVSYCDAVNGCVLVPIVCPAYEDFCQTPVCDDTIGCTPVPTACVVDDPDCYYGSCDSVARKCNTLQRDDWTTRTSSNGITCFVLYEQGKTAAIITGGVIAGIVVGAVVFAALAAVAARKAYLIMQLRQGNMGAAQTNPLYTPGTSSGDNPLFNG